VVPVRAGEQRTRAYESDRDIQRGLLVGANYQQLDVGTYFFNPCDEEPTFVISVGLSFLKSIDRVLAQPRRV
jgi:hypothetical protein